MLTLKRLLEPSRLVIKSRSARGEPIVTAMVPGYATPQVWKAPRRAECLGNQHFQVQHHTIFGFISIFSACHIARPPRFHPSPGMEGAQAHGARRNYVCFLGLSISWQGVFPGEGMNRERGKMICMGLCISSFNSGVSKN